MRVPKPFAIFGFHFCSTVFIGLSAYGLMKYLDQGLVEPESLPAAGAYAAAILASIAGICVFGREADRRKAEEARTAASVPSPPEKKSKKK